MDTKSKFIQIARCPNCGSNLSEILNGLDCQSCKATFFKNEDDIFLFSPLTTAEKKLDKYEKIEYVDKYTGLWAFGYKVFGFGQIESLHRTVNQLVLSSATTNEPINILDVGCGVGRSTSDCAKCLPNSFVLGVDLSETKLKRAKKIIFGIDEIPLNLCCSGFGKKVLKGLGLQNAFLIQASAEQLPLASDTFDIVINVNLIDRVKNPEQAIKNMISVLKPGGSFIFTNPLNWQSAEFWNMFPTKEKLETLFMNNGLVIEESFDGLIYREIHDARGSYEDWNMLIISAFKGNV